MAKYRNLWEPDREGAPAAVLPEQGESSQKLVVQVGDLDRRVAALEEDAEGVLMDLLDAVFVLEERMGKLLDLVLRPLDAEASSGEAQAVRQGYTHVVKDWSEVENELFVWEEEGLAEGVSAKAKGGRRKRGRGRR